MVWFPVLTDLVRRVGDIAALLKVEAWALSSAAAFGLSTDLTAVRWPFSGQAAGLVPGDISHCPQQNQISTDVTARGV